MTWPSLLRHLGPDVPPLNRLICMRALTDVAAVCEEPASSNRGSDIDDYNRRAGSPLGSFWCASWATAVWEDCKVDVPKHSRAATNEIVDWAMKEKLWIPHDPVKRDPVVLPGSLVLYTNGETLPNGRKKTVHVGIAVRMVPYLLTIEGNAAFGGIFSNNGEAVVLKRPELRRIYGFVAPRRT